MKYFSIPLLFLVPFFTSANHSCIGKVNNIDIAGSATLQVNIQGIGDGNRLCSLKVKTGEYEPEACKAVLSMLMAAKMADKDVALYFRNDTNTSCNKGNWKNFTDAEHGLYYVRLLN